MTNQDGISLFDLLLILKRQKNNILIIIVIFFTAGLLLAYLLPGKYKYFAAVKLPTFERNRTILEIGNHKKLYADIINEYIPNILDENKSRFSENNKNWKINVEIPSNKNMLHLLGHGKTTNKEFYLSVMDLLIDRVKNDADIRTNKLKVSFENEIRQVKVKLAFLEQEKKSLVSEMAFEDKKGALLEAELNDMKVIYENEEKNKRMVIGYTKNKHGLMNLLAISNSLIEFRNSMSRLVYAIQYGIPKRKYSLSKEMYENERGFLTNKNLLENLQAELSSIKPLQVVSMPQESIYPVGLSKKNIIVFGPILGLLVGFFFAYIIETK